MDAANKAIDTFISNARSGYSSMIENWLEGTGRNSAEGVFNSFISSANTYKQTLSEVSSNIATALQNYNF